MSSNAPWSVKGIDPKAREIAKDLARRSGKTLGEWLNEVIIEGEGADGEPAKGAAPSAAGPSDDADRGPYREVMSDLSRQAARETAGARGAYRDFSAREDLERARPARDEGEARRGRPTASLYPDQGRRARFEDDYAGDDELSRVTRALDRLSTRIEAAENRSTVAISGIDQSVVGVLTRLDHVERENTSIAARFEGGIEELRLGQRRSDERLRALEDDDHTARQAEGMRSLEAALGKIAGQLYEGEQRTQASIGEIRQGVREELTQAEYRTRAATGELREEINDSEQRARAAFGVLREELTEREHRTHSSLESLHQVVTQTDQAAREQLGAVREDMSSLSARVERTEMRQQASPLLPPRPAPDPGVVVEQVVARVAQRLEQAESKTADALRSLQSSFAGLDQRLRAAEGAVDPAAHHQAESRFEMLASDLTHAVEQARFDMAEQLSASADNMARVVEQTRTELAGKLTASADDLGRVVDQVRAETADKLTATADGRRLEALEQSVRALTADAGGGRIEALEQSVRELTVHVETAERRSAEAIERMGQEVLRVTEAMTARLSGAAVGDSNIVERVSAVVDQRLARADATQAEALDRLGDEMGRISERLAERVDVSERRSADAIEEVGDRVAGVAERLNERFERTAESLTERMRQGDERAQRLHDEARERLEQRLGAAERGLTEKVEQRLTETQRGLVERVEQRVGDVQRGLVEKVDKVDQRVGDVQRGLVDTVQQRVGEVQRGLSSSFEQRFGETQRSLAEVASRVSQGQTQSQPQAQSQAQPVAESSGPDYAATVMAPPPSSFADDDLDLAPFGSVEPDSPPAATQPEAVDSLRRTPLEPDVFVEPPLALEATAPWPAAEIAPESGPELEAEPELEAAAEPEPEPEPAVEAPVIQAAADEAEADSLFGPVEDPAPLTTAPHVVPASAIAAPSLSTALDPFDDAFDAADEFVTKPADPVVKAAVDLPPPVAAKPAEPASQRTSTRDMLEQARAAAKRAMAEPAKGKAKPAPLPAVSTGGMRDLGPPPPMAGLKNSGLKGPGLGSLLSNLRKGKKDEREGSMRTFALVAGTSFAVGLTATGYFLMQRNDTGADTAERDGPNGRIASTDGALAETPMAASLTVDEPARPSAAAARGDAATALYAGAVRLIEGGDAGRGMADLRRAADQGHAPAQFYLAKLYENGEAGLPRDAAQARRWTERAAQGGDRKAMHNLALFYFSGDGGQKNMTTAAQWFRRAADQGLVDSQYNLGRLYEEGFGVTTNPAEAYKWYLIAGRAGDGEARTSAERIKRSMPPEAQAAAQRSALAFRSPATPAPARAASSMGASEIAAAQRALSRLGYYRGPSDGVSSPALARAISAWQREQGLAATGAVNGDTLARLAATAG